MGTFSSLEEARKLFKNDRFATDAGMQVDELTDNTSTCSLILTDAHKNAYGGVMGGVIFTLADFALAVIANHIHYPSVASQISINYLSAAKGEKLTATATYRKDGRSSCVVNVDVVDDAGRDIAQFVGLGFKLKPAR